MKKLAIRSLGWGVGAMALLQLPVQASNSPLHAAASIDGQPLGQQQIIETTTTEKPQQLAASLGVRSLRQGDFGVDVRILQRYLSRNGLYPFEIDGEYGIETANAVTTYQRIRDLPATGVADEATLRDMEFDFLPEAGQSTSVTSAPASTTRLPSLLSNNLGPGSSASDVIALQQRLNDLGISIFVDGVYGFETEQAVRTYQRVQELPVTGTADRETLTRMGFNSTTTNTRAASTRAAASSVDGNLVPGSTGPNVTALQRRLNDYGIPLFVDGVYGFETEQAVRTYQGIQGLPVTGTADNETLESMGFELPDYPYVAAVIADESQLTEVQQYFPSAFIDRNRRGRFINIGAFAERFPAEARVDAAAARGFTTRVLYR